MIQMPFHQIADKRVRRYVRANPKLGYNKWPTHIKEKYYAAMTGIAYTTT